MSVPAAPVARPEAHPPGAPRARRAPPPSAELPLFLCPEEAGSRADPASTTSSSGTSAAPPVDAGTPPLAAADPGAVAATPAPALPPTVAQPAELAAQTIAEQDQTLAASVASEEAGRAADPVAAARGEATVPEREATSDAAAGGVAEVAQATVVAAEDEAVLVAVPGADPAHHAESGPTGDDDIYATGGPALSVDGEGAAAVAALRQRALTRVATLPPPRVSAGGGGGAIETAAQRRARLTDLDATHVAGEAQDQVPPVPAELTSPPAPTDENPVPTARFRVDRIGTRRLEDQTPPALPPGTPLGNPLRLTARPVSDSELARAHAIGAAPTAAPVASSPAPAPGSDEATAAATAAREREQALALRARMLNPPAPPAAAGTSTALVDRPPRHAPVTPALRGQAADVYARLLAQPEERCSALFLRVQQGVFGAAAGGGSDVGAYGRTAFLPELQREFTRSITDIATHAGIATRDLDAAVADRRATIAREAETAATAVAQAGASGIATVVAAGERRQVAVAGQHARLIAQAEATIAQPTAGIGGGVAAVRDRLISELRVREAEIDTAFRLALRRRERELDDAITAQDNAYRAGAQVDQFQLGEIATLAAPRRTLAAAAFQRIINRPPAVAGTLSAAEAGELSPRITAWGQDAGASARITLTGYKTAVQTATRVNRDALRGAGTHSVKEVRDWADEQLHEHRGWLSRLIQRAMDWAHQLQANADTWRAAQDAENAAADTDDLDLTNRTIAAMRAGVTRDELLDGNTLTREQRELIDACFSAGRDADPIQIVANRTVERVFDSRRDGLVQGLTSHFETDANISRSRITALVGGDVDGRAERIHNAMYGRGTLLGLDAIGTNEGEIYSNMGGLSPIQMIGLKKCYRQRYGHDLSVALKDELEGEELQRAQDLSSGDAVGAATAALYSAMHETFLGTGLGTDAPIIHETLRSLTPEQRTAVIALYQQRYGLDLGVDMRGELDDWATLTTHEADRAEAERVGDFADADGIELEQIGRTTIFHTNTVGEMEAVYQRLDREVRAEAERGGFSSYWVANELARRRALIETRHDARYATPDAAGETSGTLRQTFAFAARQEQMFYGSTEEHREAGETLLNALADGNEALAGASHLRLERTALIYADDRVVASTYSSQYDRALADTRLDLEAGIRRRLMEELERNDRLHQLSPEQRFAELRRIDRLVLRELETEARRRAEGRVSRMEAAYEAQYHEPASTVVEENTSGLDRVEIGVLRTSGGYLTPYNRLLFSTHGDGTREEALVAATAGLSRAEIAELDRRWQLTHRNEDGTPQTLADLGMDELSGTDLGRYQIAILGVPETVDEEIEVLRARMTWEMPTSGAGRSIATDEREMMAAQLARLVNMRDGMRRTDLSREERDAYVGAFTQQSSVASSAVDNYRDVRNAIVDSITTAIGVVIGVIVGAILTFLTAGAAALVLVAVLGSLISTAATMTAKYLLLGNNYGAADIGMDLAVGLIDAVVSGLTAGMGGRLLGQVSNTVKTQATTITARGLRGALQRVGAGLGRGRSALAGFAERGTARIGGNEGLLTRMVRPSEALVEMMRKGGIRAEAAQFMSAMAENLVQSAPSALFAVAADDKGWEAGGNQFSRILSGTGQALGPGLLMGAGMHVGMRGGGSLMGGAGNLWRLARHGPDLGGDVHGPRHHATGSERWNERIAGYRQTWGSEADVRLRADLDLEFASAQRRFELHEAQREPVRQHLDDLLADEPALAREVPVTVVSDVEFRRLNGMRRGDALVHVAEDGQVRVVVREGAPPAGVRRALEAELPRLREIEPGTGGRIRSASLEGVLPRDLRGRLPVVSDPTLPARTVLVVHDPSPRLILGPGARAADVRTHLATARNALQLHGAYGRVRALLDGISDWVFRHGEPPIGSRAWEAQEELGKLPGVIDARRVELEDPRLTPRQRAEIEADIAHLNEQIARHHRTFAEMDLEPGRGFIAAEGRPRADIAVLDAEHVAWSEQMRAHGRGEGPPPPAWTGPRPQLDGQGSWRGFDVREAHAAYRHAVAEGGGAYEAGIFRDRITGEYSVVLGRRGSVSSPGESAGRSWETIAHYHPNQENAPRFTLPAQADVWQAMMARFRDGQGDRPHVEFVDSVFNGVPTRVAIVTDASGMRLEMGIGVLGNDAPAMLPIRDPGDGYLRWWRGQDPGGPPPRLARDEGTTWVPEGSMEARDLLRESARRLGHTETEAAINAAAPERAGVAVGPTQDGVLGPPPGRVDTSRLDAYPRTRVGDSPLEARARAQQGVVRQVGGEWSESGGVYRYVEAVDGQGRVIHSYGETRENGSGPWVKRGSEINQQGAIGERASEINVRNRAGPHDFLVNAQNASGQGFDKVRVAFDQDMVVIENGVPRLRDPAYVPRLVIGEDKLMAQVSLESITAIRTNLIDNLVDKLANRLVDWNQGAIAGDLSALGISGPHARFQAEMLLTALMHRNFEFEITVGHPDSLAALHLPDGSVRADGDLQRLILHRLRLAIEQALGGHPVSITRVVVTAAELRQAISDLQAERRIGQRTTVDAALGLPPGTTSDAQLRSAWLASLADAGGALPSRLAPARTPGELIAADGRPLRVIAADPGIAASRTIQPVGREVLRALSSPRHDPLGVHPPLVVIDITGMSPAHIEALAAYVGRYAGYRHGPDAIAGIITVDTATHRVAPLLALPAAQVP